MTHSHCRGQSSSAAADGMRDAWAVIALDLPKFGPGYVWLTVSRRGPEEVIERYRRSATPDGVTVTAGGGVLSTQHRSPCVGLRRREAQRLCDEMAVRLSAEGFRVLSEPPRMARVRRLVRETGTASGLSGRA